MKNVTAKLWVGILGIIVFVATGFAEAAEAFPSPAISVLYITGNDERTNEEAASALMGSLGQMKSVTTVERTKLYQVFSEQQLIDAGIVQALSNNYMQAIGLDYVLIGEISMQAGWGYTLTGRPCVEYTATMHVRLVDARRNVGSVVWSGQDTSTSQDDDGIGAVNEAAYDCIRQLYSIFPVKGYIVALKNDEYFIDLDTSKGIERKDVLFVRGGEQTIVHPATGERMNIGSTQGELVVKEVHEGYCVAKLRKGDRIGVGAVVTKKLAGKPRILGMFWNGKIDF